MMKIIKICGTVFILSNVYPSALQAYNTYQSADVIIGQPNMTSSEWHQYDPNANWLYQPQQIYSDGARLFVADSYHCRVLMYNSIPTTNNPVADIAIGQPNMTSCASGTNGNTLNYPKGVFGDGSRVFIADTGNSRVLIYSYIPTYTGAGANIVIGQVNMTSNLPNNGGVNANGLNRPTCVYSDGVRLFVADQTNNRILIYNAIPTTANHVPADIVVGQPNMTSNSNGYNANALWMPSGVCTDGTRLYIADYGNNRVLIYNTIPTANGTAADVVVGQPNMTSNTWNNGGLSAKCLNIPSLVYSNGNSLFVSDLGNYRVLIYNTIPTSDFLPADAVIGQPSMTSLVSGANANSLGYAASIYSDGNRLFVADSTYMRILIYYPPQLASVFPNYGLSGKTVQIMITGAEQNNVSPLVLSRNSYPNLSGFTGVQNNFFSYTYTLDLNQAQPNCYDVTITANSTTRSLKQAFTVLSPLQAPVIWTCNDLGVTLTAGNIPGTACSLAIGDADQDNTQELYVANEEAGLFQIKKQVNGWSSNSVPSGASGAGFNSVLLADGNGDQAWELYGTSKDDHAYEFRTASWLATDLPDPAGAGSLYGLTALDADHDGIVEIYASRSDGHLLKIRHSGSVSISDITPAGFTGGLGYSLATGDGNNDGTLKLYSANLDHKIYQYTCNGAWQATPLGIGTNIMYSVAVGDGDNDGKNEVYGANKDCYIYQCRWNSAGGAWSCLQIGLPGKDAMYAVAVSDAENCGTNQVYAACGDGHVYEYKYDKTQTTWSTLDLGNAGTPLYALAIGDADNDHQFEVYALGQNNHIYQFKAAAVPAAAATPTIMATATITTTPTITIPQNYFKIFHSQINPLRGEQARIRWTQPQTGPVSITIYNLLGDKVVALVDNASFPAGVYHEFLWNGKTSRGAMAGSGIYIVYLQTGDAKAWSKVAVVK
jgi:hypothetical protein